ncbi:MAG: hypothetical protein KAU35_06430 [candidate division Zixibacteria bacterium]|nr:hypothetical protein [candidate division Zixibacteria bacterium]
MKRFISIMIAVAAVVILAFTAAADVPQMINYQGRLTDDQGGPVTSTVSMTFTIYDASVGGDSKWTETQSAVTVTDGLFNVRLGSVNPISDTVFNEDNRYLAITVGGDAELTPRTMMVAVPYASRIATVDGASGGNITGSVSIGLNNNNTGLYSFVAGKDCAASDNWSTVGGGFLNQATEESATVSGGSGNSATFPRATVGGGWCNHASGYNATVPGGNQNEASGTNSFAAGRRAKAINDGAFVWGDNTSADFASTGDNQFLVRASGGVGIGLNNPTTALEVNGTIKSRSGGFEFPDGSTQTMASITVPVGSIIAWVKSFPNTPVLQEEYVECNGQTLSDPDSPYNGQTIPNLNGTTGIHRFLRGNLTSGGTGGYLKHEHTVSTLPWPVQSGFTGAAAQVITYTTSNESHLPQYYHVVWIMRIK